MSTQAEVARWLAESAGVVVPASAFRPRQRCPQLDWAASGAMMLTGAEVPGLAPGPVVPILRAVGDALEFLTPLVGERAGIDPTTVLGARAGLRRTARQGRISLGGTTRLLPTADGWAAVSLARPDDVDAVPAMFSTDPDADPWDGLQAAAAVVGTADFVDRIRLFGVPAAAVPDGPPEPDVPWTTTRIASPLAGARLDGALVVDLSSLWAGPLCGQILGRAGARVVKVESLRRPDGARRGDPRFYDWLHAGHESVGLDFTVAEDRAALAGLIESADVVIEASRPRALAQLGLAHDQLRLSPGAVWVSITGHGRSHPDLVAFGDDAAAAGGLVDLSGPSPTFCADAIADPLTGVVAALAAVASRSTGGGQLIDVAMSRVAAAFAGIPLGCDGGHLVDRRRKTWFLTCRASGEEQRVLGPRVPDASGRAPVIGADNHRWFGMVGA